MKFLESFEHKGPTASYNQENLHKVEELNFWQKKVISKILLVKEPLITSVYNVDFFAYLAFNRTTYDDVIVLINNQDWEKLKAKDDKCQNNFKEDLILVRFTNQDNQNCLAAIYDSDELWQDPEVIDVFTFN